MTDNPPANPAPLQNPPISQISLYIAITFEPMLQFYNPSEFRIYYENVKVSSN